jgi:hypothetical protein
MKTTPNLVLFTLVLNCAVGSAQTAANLNTNVGPVTAPPTGAVPSNSTNTTPTRRVTQPTQSTKPAQVNSPIQPTVIVSVPLSGANPNNAQSARPSVATQPKPNNPDYDTTSSAGGPSNNLGSTTYSSSGQIKTISAPAYTK